MKPFLKPIVHSPSAMTNRVLIRNSSYITINSDSLKSILATFREDIIFYATDLVGTDFKQVIDFSIRR